MPYKKYIIPFISVILFALFAYFFTSILVYIIVALIVSLIGKPLVQIFHKYARIPTPLAALLSLISISCIFFLLLYWIMPLLVNQVNQLSQLNYDALNQSTQDTVKQGRQWLAQHGIYFSQGEIETYLLSKGQDILSAINLQSIVGGTINVLSSFFIGLFSVLFIAFFFLKDELLFRKIIFMFIPDEKERMVQEIMDSSQRLLTRYFVGLCAELSAMMMLISFGLWIFGVENALLYGCLGGLFNVIPYLGPVLGAITACMLACIGAINGGITPELGWMIVKIIGVFSCSNLIDNFLLQPIIYSNSVKAHPLEIFFVIIIAAGIGGVIGMIIAVPIYTLLRIIAKELFSKSKFVRHITRKL